MLVFVLSFILSSCKTSQFTAKEIDLSESDKAYLIKELDQMLEDDQKYRTPLSLGTLDEAIIAEDEEKSKTLDIEAYMAYRNSLDIEEMPKSQIDSLWALQHEIDYNNYLKIKSIIKKYGYPSKERLGTKTYKFFVLLLHPSPRLNPKEYRDEMAAIFANEVRYNRMEPELYASFYDNITYKIMRQPMLYGTGNVYNHKTQKLDPPFIGSLEKSNKARKKIGLPLLKDGEYQIAQK